ncbi:MAG TPA: hypothetical protein ENN77_00315, partial [Candidatus Wirthbacteria bacterium]|nr:hypothetical protein [Candidatus Wirthbacteria bacterium]
PQPNLRLDDLDLDLITQIKIEIEEKTNTTYTSIKKLFAAYGLLDPAGQPNKFCLLLFGNQPQRFIKNSYLTIVKYNQHLDMEVNRNYLGNLIHILEDAYADLTDLIPTKEVIDPKTGKRMRTPIFPYVAVREVLVNAIVHRDYNLIGSRVIISIYPDRIEFQSPGNLPAGITPKTILRSQYSRNPEITEILNYLGYLEQLGSGLDRTFQAYQNSNLPPSIENFDNMVIVTLYKID